MMNKRVHTTIVAAAFGGLLGLVAAGVWALDRPAEVAGDTYVIEESSGHPSILAPPDLTFTGGGFVSFAPVPDSRLPMPLWVAIPAATATTGAVVGAAASMTGVRISRRQ